MPSSSLLLTSSISDSLHPTAELALSPCQDSPPLLSTFLTTRCVGYVWWGKTCSVLRTMRTYMTSHALKSLNRLQTRRHYRSVQSCHWPLARLLPQDKLKLPAKWFSCFNTVLACDKLVVLMKNLHSTFSATDVKMRCLGPRTPGSGRSSGKPFFAHVTSLRFLQFKKGTFSVILSAGRHARFPLTSVEPEWPPTMDSRLLNRIVLEAIRTKTAVENTKASHKVGAFTSRGKAVDYWVETSSDNRLSSSLKLPTKSFISSLGPFKRVSQIRIDAFVISSPWTKRARRQKKSYFSKLASITQTPQNCKDYAMNESHINRLNPTVIPSTAIFVRSADHGKVHHTSCPVQCHCVARCSFKNS